MGVDERISIVWAPQKGPQASLVSCPAEELFFGGCRGGGKTDGVIGKWGIKALQYGNRFNAAMFRRTLTSADDAIQRSREIYEPLGGTFRQDTSRWIMPGGGRIAFRYLDSIADADHQQGKNLTDAWVEEAGQYADPAPIDRLFGALRSPTGVPIQLILTANPGGAGQSWLRDRYQLSPLPSRPTVMTRYLDDGTLRKFAVIPSRITDNQILMKSDPGYVDRLKLVGNPELVRAWLEGDWSAIEGAFFSDWDESLVLDPFQIPDNWIRFRAFDWGSARPFSVGWWAFATEGHAGVQKGSLVRYREWYGASKPNVGLKFTAGDVTAGILEREEPGERIDYSVADPAIFYEDGGPSIAERMLPITWQPADNRRVGVRGHMGGWDQVRARMRDGLLFVFSTCSDFRRTIPLQQHDIKRPEDMDSNAEDHIADEMRYACMTRIYNPLERPKEVDQLKTALPLRGKSQARKTQRLRRH